MKPSTSCVLWQVNFNEVQHGSMINKNSEGEIGVQLEGPKSKACSYWINLTSSEMVILPPGISE